VPVKSQEQVNGVSKVAEVPQSLDQTVAVPVGFLAELMANFNKMHEDSLKAILAEMRKPVVDPIKEAQQQRAAQSKQQAEDAYWSGMIFKAENCPSSHLREDGSSAIAWATQSDGKIRGVCQHCNTLFSPTRKECVSEAVWKAYGELRRIPSSRGNSVMYIG